LFQQYHISRNLEMRTNLLWKIGSYLQISEYLTLLPKHTLLVAQPIISSLSDYHMKYTLYFSYRKQNARGDPIVCGVAVLLCLPFLFAVLILSKTNFIITWICVFFAETLLCSNWALISDMIMVKS
jgi:hypothetical protein